MSPIDILQQELNVYKKALELSKKKFAAGLIDAKLHETHVGNLEPQIRIYTNALRILRFYTDD